MMLALAGLAAVASAQDGTYHGSGMSTTAGDYHFDATSECIHFDGNGICDVDACYENGWCEQAFECPQGSEEECKWSPNGYECSCMSVECPKGQVPFFDWKTSTANCVDGHPISIIAEWEAPDNGSWEKDCGQGRDEYGNLRWGQDKYFNWNTWMCEERAPCEPGFMVTWGHKGEFCISMGQQMYCKEGQMLATLWKQGGTDASGESEIITCVGQSPRHEVFMEHTWHPNPVPTENWEHMKEEEHKLMDESTIAYDSHHHGEFKEEAIATTYDNAGSNMVTGTGTDFTAAADHTNTEWDTAANTEWDTAADHTTEEWDTAANTEWDTAATTGEWDTTNSTTGFEHSHEDMYYDDATMPYDDAMTYDDEYHMDYPPHYDDYSGEWDETIAGDYYIPAGDYDYSGEWDETMAGDYYHPAGDYDYSGEWDDSHMPAGEYDYDYEQHHEDGFKKKHSKSKKQRRSKKKKQGDAMPHDAMPAFEHDDMHYDATHDPMYHHDDAMPAFEHDATFDATYDPMFHHDDMHYDATYDADMYHHDDAMPAFEHDDMHYDATYDPSMMNNHHDDAMTHDITHDPAMYHHEGGFKKQRKHRRSKKKAGSN